jgi:hypothetical protein
VVDSGCTGVDGEGRIVVAGSRAVERVVIRERQSPHIMTESPTPAEVQARTTIHR